MGASYLACMLLHANLGDEFQNRLNLGCVSMFHSFKSYQGTRLFDMATMKDVLVLSAEVVFLSVSGSL